MHPTKTKFRTGAREQLMILNAKKSILLPSYPARSTGNGKNMSGKWQKGREFFFAGHLPCKKGKNFSSLAFCHANEARIFPRWLFAMQKGQEIFSAGFLPCKKVKKNFSPLFSDATVTVMAWENVCFNQNDDFSPFCGALQEVTALENQDISEGLVAKIIMKLTFIKFGMKVTEVADLTRNIGDLYNAFTAKLEDQYLHNVMEDLKDLSDRITGVLKHNHVVSCLEDLDLHRDHCVRAILNLKRAYVKLSDNTIQSHWTALKPMLEDYIPSILEGNYQSKTALVDALLKDLAVPDAAVHVTELPGLSLAVEKLQDAQTAFVDKRLEYQLLALDGHTESATDLKEQIVETVNQKLLLHLEDMSKVNPESYGNFTLLVTNLVKSSNLKVNRRRNKKETSVDIPTKE